MSQQIRRRGEQASALFPLDVEIHPRHNDNFIFSPLHQWLQHIKKLVAVNVSRVGFHLPAHRSALVQTAPSQVSEVIKEKVQQRSIQLSWQEPRQPNGVITEYEIKYYEKVSSTVGTISSLLQTLHFVFYPRCHCEWNSPDSRKCVLCLVIAIMDEDAQKILIRPHSFTVVPPPRRTSTHRPRPPHCQN